MARDILLGARGVNRSNMVEIIYCNNPKKYNCNIQNHLLQHLKKLLQHSKI